MLGKHAIRLGLVLVPLSLALQGCTLIADFVEGAAAQCGRPDAAGLYPALAVTTTADLRDGYCTAGECSLFQAVKTNDLCGGIRTITLRAGAEYIVTGRVISDPFGPEAFPSIRNRLTIEGNGATVRANPASPTETFRLFTVLPPGELSLVNVTLAGGNARQHRRLPRPDEQFVNYGGAVFNRGTLRLRGATLTDNGAVARGGAIYNSGVLSIEGGTFRNNNASAIYNDVGGSASIRTTNFSGNRNLDTLIATASGGAVRNFGAVEITESELVDNEAGRVGGAIYTEAAMTISKSTIANNRAGGDGGGVSIRATALGPVVRIESSTFSGNTAPIGAAIIGLAFERVELRDTTVYANTAGNPMGGAINVSGPSSWTVGNTLLANNVNGNCGIAGAVTRSAENLSSDVSCSVFARMVTGLTLGGLAANGGPTRTHALPAGSAAIDAGSDCDRTDQRGSPRPTDGNRDGRAVCDVGAFEAAPG